VSRGGRGVAMTSYVHDLARAHLLRADGQEDLCFALWNPSRGRERTTALVERLIFPEAGDRLLHGNVSFTPQYFERALSEAATTGCGLALMHSHPLGQGWQGMSPPDVVAEQTNAGAVYGATDLPFVGLTLSGDAAWCARFWERTAPRTYLRKWCSAVRVVGDRLTVTYMDELAPRPTVTNAQVRTVSAWGEAAQAHLVRLRVGVIGAGSVGGFIGESLARTGFEDITAIDYDFVEEHNLDRLLYATHRDVGALKVRVLGEHLAPRATANPFRFDPVVAAVYEEPGFRAALDCDVLFSCVDRPWGRHVLNFIANAHLIPVVDGGIHVRRNRHGQLAAADWRTHTATFGRACLQCVGQYDPGLVQVEREGYLDDPTYIERLPEDHELRARENVFAFSMACAAQQNLQMLALALAPLDQPNPGTQRYHFVGNFMADPQFNQCKPGCFFRTLVASGDSSSVTVTGPRPPRRTQPAVII
jgi:molybdopterin-synthase adenylyltransferase